MTGGEREQAVLENVPRDLFIGGEWRAATGGGRLGVEDPSTEQTLVEVADGQAEDAMAALARGSRETGRVGADRAARARRDPAQGL